MTRSKMIWMLAPLAALMALGCADDGPSTRTLAVDAAGGTLVLGNASVVVPTEALAESTTLTLTRLAQTDVTALGSGEEFTGQPFELAPTTTVFAMPVAITLPYSGGDEDLFVFAASGTDAPWAIVAGATFADGVASFSHGSGGVFVVVRALATDLPALGATPAFAVVSSDYSSTAIAMLDGEGDALDAEWFTSADALAGLVAALGGDVSLPTTPEAGHVVVLDRFRVDVITRVAIPGGELVGQLRTHSTAGVAGFSSNPQDYLALGSDRAWISRFGQNPDAAVEASEAGTDLIEIDPTTMARTGARVDLSSFSTLVGETDVLARPSRMLRLGDYVAVGLGLLSADFSASADGVVVLVDPADASLTSVTLTGLRNCGTMVPVPEDDTRALVACTGHSGTFDAAEVRASAGVVVVHLNGDALEEEARWEASTDAGAAVAVNGITAISADEFVAAEYGDFIAPTNDAVYRVVISTGVQTQVATAEGQYQVGTMAFDAASGLLLVPDASEGLRRFTLTETTATEGTAVALTMARGLPPRHATLVAR
jgi:hypothetical protein